jgi:hypothetical protein
VTVSFASGSVHREWKGDFRMADLPLSGKRWIWILLGLVVIIVLGVIVSSVPSDYTEPVNEPGAVGARAEIDDGPYSAGVAPVHPPDTMTEAPPSSSNGAGQAQP